MKPSAEQEAWLKIFHWEDLANLQYDLGFVRHQVIHAVNSQVAVPVVRDFHALDQLAQVDELLQSAGAMLEKAKITLFDLCYEQGGRKLSAG